MKLYDGTGEYIPASEVQAGQLIRCEDGQIREVLFAKPEGQMTVIGCTDGFGFERPHASRILRKYEALRAHSPENH